MSTINASIREIAGAASVPVLDLNAFTTERLTNGREYAGVTLSGAFLTGGLVGYVGIHPTETGYALVANEWIAFLNREFGTRYQPVALAPFIFDTVSRVTSLARGGSVSRLGEGGGPITSWHGRKISPVYQLLPNLQEPDWKFLRIGDVREFWERPRAWDDRVELAHKDGHIGAVLVLADQAPVAAFRADAWIIAGEALRKAERYEFALEQLQRGLEVDPANLKGLHAKGICLQRLASVSAPGHSLDRARKHYEEVVEIYPNDPETWALLGRVDKDAWVAVWRQPGKTPEEMREEAAYEDALLRAAIDSYTKGFP